MLGIARPPQKSSVIALPPLEVPAKFWEITFEFKVWSILHEANVAWVPFFFPSYLLL